MRCTFLQSILSLWLFAVSSGCTSLPAAGNKVAENLASLDSKTLPESQVESVSDQLKVGQSCRFVFTEDPPMIPAGSSLVITDDLGSCIESKMGGRVVRIQRGHVVLAEVVQIIDPWSPSPGEMLRSPSQLFQKRKEIALQPISGNSAKESAVSLRQITHVETMDRQAWLAFCESAYRKPAPMDFSFTAR